MRGERNARPHDSPPLVGEGLGVGSMPGVHANCHAKELHKRIPYEICFAARDVLHSLQTQVDFYTIFRIIFLYF